MSGGSVLFDRLVVTHRPDCSLHATDQVDLTADEGVGTNLQMAEGYFAACGSIYEDLRRVIGQMSGLVVLAYLTERRDVLDIPELGDCDRRLARASDAACRLQPPALLAGHKALIDRATNFLCIALRTFSVLPKSGARETLDDVSDLLKAAYRDLSSATTEKNGLRMVDFKNACCCGDHKK